jgi:hypothetical protein
MTTDLHDRKLGFWEMFGVSWKIFCQQFKFIFIIMLGLYAILTGADALGGLFIPSELSDHWAANVFRISNVFGFVGPVVVIAIANQSIKENPINWRTLWQLVRPLLLPALLIHLLFVAGKIVIDLPMQFISTGNSPLQILVFAQIGMHLISLILGIYFVFTYQALVFKGQRGVSAFICSLRAVTGSWWRLFAVRALLVLPFIIFFLPIHLCDPEFIQRIYMPISQHLISPVFAVLTGYFTIFYTLFFLNIVRHDVRFSETVNNDD